jgi:hypothetical protein
MALIPPETNWDFKKEILTLLPLCDSPRIPQLSRASTFQMITKSYNTSEYKKIKPKTSI